jgi:SAM-dependent methyltransferase
MTEKQWQVFFEVHSNNLREGPGSRQSTAKAFSLISGLPPEPKILDIGCGPGTPSLHLAELSHGQVWAVDNHTPFIESLKTEVEKNKLSARVFPAVADMSRLPFVPASFDLIWAEGSIFILGVEKALKLWRPLLKNKGVIAFTESSWLKQGIPEELNKFWQEVYPAICPVSQNIEVLNRSGFELIKTFTLPESDWWDYYKQNTKKLPLLREKHKSDPEALEVLDFEDKEMEMYRKYSEYYGYVFYLGRKKN